MIIIYISLSYYESSQDTTAAEFHRAGCCPIGPVDGFPKILQLMTTTMTMPKSKEKTKPHMTCFFVCWLADAVPWPQEWCWRRNGLGWNHALDRIGKQCQIKTCLERIVLEKGCNSINRPSWIGYLILDKRKWKRKGSMNAWCMAGFTSNGPPSVRGSNQTAVSRHKLSPFVSPSVMNGYSNLDRFCFVQLHPWITSRNSVLELPTPYNQLATEQPDRWTKQVIEK